jgi:glutamate-5-semialdehyde dehydrogenase
VIDAALLERVTLAKRASRALASLPSSVKDRALRASAERLRTDGEAILAANAKDVAAADAAGIAAPMRKRLLLDAKKIEGMAAALEEIAGFPDPIGRLEEPVRRPDGLEIARMRVPLGVIAMVYESRPNATSDAAGLCLKSGNAVILRGGKEALHSNLAIASALSAGAASAGVPDGWMHVVATTDREQVAELLKLDSLIDLVVPRGGEELIRFVSENARMPVLRHAKGVCHVYVDASADLDAAEKIVVNAKAQNTAVCNAAEALLVHASLKERFVPRVTRALLVAGVELRGDAAFVAADPRVTPAREADWGTEFLAPIMACRVVPGLDDALEHIARHGSHHSEAIVTSDAAAGLRFQREVDASAVLVNASTRLNDGGVFGLGAELGISTSKLHAYGPMGVNELTTRKFVVTGTGHIRN